jgi:hypothetical protein
MVLWKGGQMLETLLYVSRSTLFMPDDEAAVWDIVCSARSRNQLLGVTGALLFTHQYFAQFLEGTEAAVADLMASIRRDPRHQEIEIVSSHGCTARKFSDWNMAYAGPSRLVGTHVESLFGSGYHGAASLAAGRVIVLMQELANKDPTLEPIAA